MRNNDSDEKQKWLRGLVKVVLGILVVSGVLLIGGFYAVDFLVDLLWFEALGYGFYFWQRVLYSYTVLVAVTLFFFFFFFVNFRYAVRIPNDGTGGNGHEHRGRLHRLLTSFRYPTFWSIVLALALSLPLALPVFRNWEMFLFAVFGNEMGVSDPYLGRDVSFYLFRFPLYTLIQGRLLLALVVLVVILVLLYALKNHHRNRSWRAFKGADKWHLVFVLLLLSGIGLWDFMLQRYALLLDTSHQPLFSGPGYVEMNVILPLIWACLVTLALTAISLIIVFYRRQGYKFGALLVLVFLVTLMVRYLDYLPHLVDVYLVKPNELKKESPFIRAHVRSTLDAYKLTDIEVRKFSRERLPQMEDTAKATFP